MFNNNRLYEIFQFVDTTISMNADDEHLTSAYDILKILFDPEKYTNLKSIWLEANGLEAIQGLENQKKLRMIYL